MFIVASIFWLDTIYSILCLLSSIHHNSSDKKSNTKINGIYRLQQMWISILREERKEKNIPAPHLTVIQSKNLQSRKQGKTSNFWNLQIGNKMWAIHRLLSMKGPGSFCAFLHSEFCICMNKAELCSYYLYNHLCCAIFFLFDVIAVYYVSLVAPNIKEMNTERPTNK